MDGNAFKSLVDQDFDEISLGIKVTNNQVLAEELGLTFRWAVVDSYLQKPWQKPKKTLLFLEKWSVQWRQASQKVQPHLEQTTG